MIYATGDTHSDVRRLSTEIFPEQKEMTKDDFVIILGDFGLVWEQEESKTERHWLDWLDKKPFTTLFVDGNHENFDRLCAYPEIDFYGGRAHQISDSVFHLMRGNMFDLNGTKCFAFGGAASHDIDDGILDPASFPTTEAFKAELKKWRDMNKMFRVKGLSWWPQELPSEEEMQRGRETIAACPEADFVLAHCCPQEIASLMSHGFYKPDAITTYFNEIMHDLRFTRWLFGHYHDNKQIMGKFVMLYEQIIRIA